MSLWPRFLAHSVYCNDHVWTCMSSLYDSQKRPTIPPPGYGTCSGHIKGEVQIGTQSLLQHLVARCSSCISRWKRRRCWRAAVAFFPRSVQTDNFHFTPTAARLRHKSFQPHTHSYATHLCILSDFSRISGHRRISSHWVSSRRRGGGAYVRLRQLLVFLSDLAVVLF